jgi:hypothetical protein
MDSADEMRGAIREAFEAGALMLQWFGHANRFRWGSMSLFTTSDPALLRESTRLPFTAAYSCWAGYFISIQGDAQTMAETLLLQPGRGSLADLSPSGLHIGSALLKLNHGITRALALERSATVGDVVSRGKRYFFENSGSWHDLIDTSVLFGDPATLLRLPPTRRHLPIVLH